MNLFPSTAQRRRWFEIVISGLIIPTYLQNCFFSIDMARLSQEPLYRYFHNHRMSLPSFSWVSCCMVSAIWLFHFIPCFELFGLRFGLLCRDERHSWQALLFFRGLHRCDGLVWICMMGFNSQLITSVIIFCSSVCFRCVCCFDGDIHIHRDMDTKWLI